MASPISFSGLSSGIDTESIISQMLEVQRQPIQRLNEKTELLGLQREALREVNTQLLSLQNMAMNLRFESTFASRTVNSSDSGKVNATATFAAARTTHRVMVHQLAQEAVVTSDRYTSQARLLGSNTVGINFLGGENYLNSPGAGRIEGGVTLNANDTLGSLGLSGDFTLRIDPDAGGGRSPVTITGLDAATSINQLVDKVRQQLDSVKLQLAYDEAAGGKVLKLAGGFVGLDVGLSGAVAEALFGIDAGATVSSEGTGDPGAARTIAAILPLELPTGTATIISSDGRAGSLTGSIDLTAAAGGGDPLALTLDQLGVTQFAGLTIDPDAGGATGNIAVLKTDGTALTGTDTLDDLIAAINASAPDVTAQLVAGSGQERYLRITANEGGRNVTISQLGADQGLLPLVLGIANTATSSDATTDSADFTLVSNFYRRGDFESGERRVVSGVKDDYRTYGVTGLIDGVAVIGAAAGQVFTPGAARIQLNSSERLAIEDSARTQFFGAAGITADTFATGLGLDTDGSGTIALNRAIKDLNAAGAFGFDGGEGGITAGTFKVGGATLTITQNELDNGITLAQVLARINSAGEGLVVSYEAAADRFIATNSAYGRTDAPGFGSYTGLEGESNLLRVLGLANQPTQVLTSIGAERSSLDSTAELVRAGFTIRPTSGTFTINGIAIEVDAAADSLLDVVDRINHSAAGVTALLDPESSRISLVQKVDEDTAEDYIRVGSSSDTSNLLTALRITGGSNLDGTVRAAESKKLTVAVGSQRKQADFEVDNIRYLRNTNSIDDITPGLSFELQGVSDSPVAISISGDKEQAIEAIAKFVVDYNKTVKMLKPTALDSSERKYLEPLTDKERSSLTYEELLNRVEKFESYNKQETIRRDSSMQILENQLRQTMFSPVGLSGSALTGLADLGITTGDPGQPLNKQYLGVLVADSTDLDEIKAALTANEKLNKALDEDDLAVYRLFGQQGCSEIKVRGAVAFDEDLPLANAISFEVYNGVRTATITLEAGALTRTNLLRAVSLQLSRAGVEDIEASFDASGRLQFESSKTTGRALIRVLDLTAPTAADRLSSRLGITGGSYVGQDAEQRAGIAERAYTELREVTGVTGFLNQRVAYGGLYGQGTIFDEMVNVQERITRLEDRIAKREERMRRDFTNMEQVISRLQQQQSAISQYAGAAASSGSSLGGGK